MDHTTLHNQAYLAQSSNVARRVTFDRDQVR
jgi:hypothetical protein